MGTEIGKLGGYGFSGAVTAGDGSNQKGNTMGAGFINLRRKKRRGQKKVTDDASDYRLIGIKR